MSVIYVSSPTSKTCVFIPTKKWVSHILHVFPKILIPYTSCLIRRKSHVFMMENSQSSAAQDIVKQGLMVKRSQNKKRFTPVNYRQRWFVLTSQSLIYYEPNSDVSQFELTNLLLMFSSLYFANLFQCSKERGRITLKYITIIEPAIISSLNNVDSNSSPVFSLNNGSLINNNLAVYPFQIGYSDSGQDYFLYLITFKEKEREDWLQTLRSCKFMFIC